ncbi:hypothetical protein LYSHEL_25880 [Lysobacter helvus]|uniref:Uncharacterized protein n=2 Tax=Lysobacteraceae TaxID=32033 RepID=A0ABN6FVT9_9GAMM|nr:MULTISPECIES: hypothetical protein [Lysobacter]BCT93564.1 hypothetical protein LYSCAS_25880 [Lysobacter caseinilyticus]BCT96717.1 hypothetical protein LYSHEL_25880 [Lysobacter helvus]
MHNFFWGALIIAIGLFNGRSVFLGDFSVLSVVFDALGLFWVGRGVLDVRRARVAASPATDSETA